MILTLKQTFLFFLEVCYIAQEYNHSKERKKKRELSKNHFVSYYIWYIYLKKKINKKIAITCGIKQSHGLNISL